MPVIKTTNDDGNKVTWYRSPYPLGCGLFDLGLEQIETLQSQRRAWVLEQQSCIVAQKAARDRDLARHWKSEGKRYLRLDRAWRLVIGLAEGAERDRRVQFWPTDLAQELDLAFGAATLL